MIKLGTKAKDIVTGFTGIITARYTFLTGCDRYQITPEVKDGVVPETMSFDENSIEIIDKGISEKFNTETEKKTKKGGPITYKCKNINNIIK